MSRPGGDKQSQESSMRINIKSALSGGKMSGNTLKQSEFLDSKAGGFDYPQAMASYGEDQLAASYVDLTSQSASPSVRTPPIRSNQRKH